MTKSNFERVNFEGFAERLLAPREIVRDAEGWLDHPEFPMLDESVRLDKFLAAFGIESAFVGMEDQDPRYEEKVWNDEDLNVPDWTPEPPDAGDNMHDWMLILIYDTKDGPVAMFCRQD